MLRISLKDEKQVETVLVTCVLKVRSQSMKMPRELTLDEGEIETSRREIGRDGKLRRRRAEEHHITSVLRLFNSRLLEDSHASTLDMQVIILVSKP